MMWEEACRILDVPEPATAAEIKEQYFYKVQLLHPDKNLDKPEKIRQKAEVELARVNEAYKFLTEPKNNPNNPPKLEVAPWNIRFTEVALNQKKATTLEIKNAGGPFTNCWIDNSPTPWLAVTDVKTTTNEALPLSVTIEAQGLPGIIRPERCTVLIRLKNEKTGLMDEAAVGIEIIPLTSSARLRIKKHKIKFQNVPLNTVSSYTLEIGNRGPDVLHGSIVTNSPWLSVSQSELILSKRTVSRSYVVNVDTENLTAGFRDTGYVRVCTNGGEAVIPIELSTSSQLEQTLATPSFYSGNRAPNQGGAYSSTYTARPAPSSGRGKRRKLWFLRFILIFAISFGAGFALIIKFTGNRPDGPDVGSIWGWGVITFFVSMLVALMRR